jgi:hypothetical protein
METGLLSEFGHVASQFDHSTGYGCAPAPYPVEWVKDRAMPLAKVLEKLCLELDRHAMTVTSGYPSRAFNEALRAAGYPVARSRGSTAMRLGKRGRCATTGRPMKKPGP